MALKLEKAERKQAKIRMNLGGASGSGKTYGALLIAKGLVGDREKIAVLDTENGSASLYSDLGPFNVINLDCFSVDCYKEAIKLAEDSGIECLIIDSISHEWKRILEQHDLLTKRGTDSFRARGALTPKHDDFLQTMLQSSMHIITCVRKKEEYAMVFNDKKGKNEVQKLGLKEVTRDGRSYEVSISLDIDQNHYITCNKDRTGLFMDKDTFIISEKTGETIKERCNSGKQLAPAEEKPKVTIAKVEPDQSATLPFEAEKPKETRVAEEKPVIPSRTVDKEKFDKVVQKIKAGKVTIEYLRDNYILTPEVAKEILAALDSENINNE